MLASERPFPNCAFRQAPHQWHGRWDVDCEHGYGTSLSSELLLNLSSYPLRRATILEAPVLGAWRFLSHACVPWWETAPLWAVTNVLSSSSQASQDLTLNPNVPTTNHHSTARSQNPHTPNIWSNPTLCYIKHIHIQCLNVIPSTTCCPVISVLMLLWVQPLSNSAHQHSCLSAWPSGD